MASNRTPHDLGPTDLVWSHFSRPRHEDVPTRIHAASAAGYAAIGLYIGHYANLRDDPAELEAIDLALDETGLMLAEIEVIQGWADDNGGPSERSTGMEELIVEMTKRWGCRYVQAIGPHEGSVDQAIVGFGSMCDRLGEHGLLVGMEWVPFTNIRNAAEAQVIVEGADRPNGGYCVDSWHLTRSTNNLDDVAKLQGDKVFAVQLNDGTIEPALPDDYYTDCLSYRVPPGEGEFALVELVQLLDGLGSTAPLSMEVPSTALWDATAAESAQVVADGMRSVLATARG